MKLQIILLSLGVSLLFGCAASQKDQLLESGKPQLDAAKLSQLLNENTLHFETIDFDAKLLFSADGRLVANARSGDSDKGKWVIDEADRLCIKFSSWYFSDLRCYDVLEEASEEYALFTTNGARAYTVTVLADGLQPAQVSSSQLTSAASNTHIRKASPPSSPLRTNKAKDTRRTLSYLASNCPGCNFVDANLQDMTLIAANLEKADLRSANFTGSNLRRANLSGADLSRAKLRHANLAGANLQNANLEGADLSGANLIKADLTNARYTNANFSGAYLEGIKGYKELQ